MRIETARGPVDGVWADGSPVLVVGHGAGGDMHAPLLAGFVDGLAEQGIGSLRFNFPYKQLGRRAPDPPAVLKEAFTAAFEEARRRAGDAGVFVGGKSLGGRIASLVVAEGMPAAGLVFVGYPLHPPGKPERLRDEHLDRIEVPMLFLQGTRDPFARWDLLTRVIEGLGGRAVLEPVEGGDHSFRVRGKRLPDEEIGRALARPAATFMAQRSRR
jgi:predicted alpha/beta-hydrolase family hydrolase